MDANLQEYGNPYPRHIERSFGVADEAQLLTFSTFGAPRGGIALILPIAHFCDLGRSATNVVGNAIATSVLCKWEGELGH